MSDAPLEITYSTTTSVKRTGPVGRLLGWLGAHPLWGGLLCGLLVVLIAALRSPGGVRSEPLTAALLSAFVILAWSILFFVMRGFFEDQSYRHYGVIRRIVLGDGEALWEQDGEILRRIREPQIRLLASPMPEEVRAGSGSQAWPVWILIEGVEEERPLVIETRDSAERAREYEELTQEIAENTDELLPRALIVPLLARAEAA